ncbi:MAG: hemin uptake protein HemP [Methylococcales bacterium]
MIRKPNDPIQVSETNISEKPGNIPTRRPCFHSSELFGSAREVIIEHAGQEYRLQLTRQGTLILTK